MMFLADVLFNSLKKQQYFRLQRLMTVGRSSVKIPEGLYECSRFLELVVASVGPAPSAKIRFDDYVVRDDIEPCLTSQQRVITAWWSGHAP
uniref:Uncharacterized protein n=1 Tax=Ascaris lumbricoides TaxID=6252 RepID=A0A0M3HT87_ASCLU